MRRRSSLGCGPCRGPSFTCRSRPSHSFFQHPIVPLYYDVRAMGLLDTYWALILLEVSGEMAFGVIWMRAAFLSAPRSLLEACGGPELSSALFDAGR